MQYILIATTILFSTCHKCSAFNNRFSGLYQHGALVLGMLSGSNPYMTSASSSHIPHYHYPFVISDDYTPTKARYPSASISSDGRYSHLLNGMSYMKRNRRSDDASTLLGYRPVRHHEEDKGPDSTLSFLLQMLGGGKSKVGQAESSNYYRVKSRNHYPNPNVVGHQHGPFPLANQPIPSILQHPLFQIVPLLVIEKRFKIRRPPPGRPFQHHYHPFPPPFFHHNSPQSHPPILQNSRGHPPIHSKIIFPSENLESNYKTLGQFQTIGEEKNGPIIPAHLHPFIVHQPVNTPQYTTVQQHKSVSNFKINQPLENSDIGDYPIVGALKDYTPHVKFPDGLDNTDADLSSFYHPYRNGHHYDSTTGPDVNNFFPLQGSESESKPIVSNTTVSSSSSNKSKFKRRNDFGKLVSSTKNTNSTSVIWVEGKPLKIPNFMPISFAASSV